MQQIFYAATRSNQEQTQHSLTRWREKPVEYYLEYPRIVSPLLSGQLDFVVPRCVTTSRGPPLCHIQTVVPHCVTFKSDVLVPLPLEVLKSLPCSNLDFYTGLAGFHGPPTDCRHSNRGPPLCQRQARMSWSPCLWKSSSLYRALIGLLYRSSWISWSPTTVTCDYVVPHCVRDKLGCPGPPAFGSPQVSSITMLYDFVTPPTGQLRLFDRCPTVSHV